MRTRTPPLDPWRILLWSKRPSRGVTATEDEALRRFEAPEIVIEADLGAGTCSTTVWTCDLTHEYVSINADYRS